MSDATTASGSVTVSEQPHVPPLPGVVHEVRAWLKPTSGTFTLTARWYNASRKLLAIKSVPIGKHRQHMEPGRSELPRSRRCARRLRCR